MFELPPLTIKRLFSQRATSLGPLPRNSLASHAGGCSNPRIYLPRRLLTPANTGSFGVDDYCELGSRFKAQHIKIMVWWIACKVGRIAAHSDAYSMFQGLAVKEKLLQQITTTTITTIIMTTTATTTKQ